MTPIKITDLTPLNVAALRETFGNAIATGNLELGATTATWPRWSAGDVLRDLDHAMRRLPGRGHPRASLHAVRRKVEKIAVDHELELELELEGGHAYHADSGIPREGCPACKTT